MRHRPAGDNLLYVEVQMARELQLSGEDLLVDPERIVVKERWIPAGGEKVGKEERNERLSQILLLLLRCNNNLMQGTVKSRQGEAVDVLAPFKNRPAT